MKIPKAVIMCKHDFQPATDLPADVFRCVKCAAAGYESLQTQFAPCNGNCRCGGE